MHACTHSNYGAHHAFHMVENCMCKLLTKGDGKSTCQGNGHEPVNSNSACVHVAT